MAKKKPNINMPNYCLPRITSGVKGLDRLIQGGFQEGSLILVSGGTGTGKTIFGLQFLYEGAQKGEPGVYVTFEEDAEDLKQDAACMGLDIEKFEKEKKFIIKSYPPFAFDQFINDIEKIIAEYKVKRMVIDSVSAFGIYSKNEYELRKRIYNIAKVIKVTKTTGVAISEVVGEATTGLGSSATLFSRFGVEEFVADALIMLHYAGLGGNYDRTLQIVKMRRTNHERGLFPISISNKGMEIIGKPE
jgi:KaiC/GvpD/RAD55 family RecA-like ATPase